MRKGMGRAAQAQRPLAGMSSDSLRRIIFTATGDFVTVPDPASGQMVSFQVSNGHKQQCWAELDARAGAASGGWLS
jgi:hypothetical protein